MQQPNDWDAVHGVLGATAAGGVVVGAVKGVIGRRGMGFWHFVALLLASALVAVLVGLAIADTSLSRTQQLAVIGVCAFLAEDILTGLGALSALFSRDPIGTIQRLWSAIRGKGEVSELRLSMGGDPLHHPDDAVRVRRPAHASNSRDTH